MENEKLQGIIKRRNERLENYALRSAEELIETIVVEQQKIAEGQIRITALRKALADLQVEQIDTKAVLGDA